ncbi:uncharacterized protein LY89DRAFT_763295 [Mollisia scopiformis]|uniref:2EXR domain-containing protein n=1 Tax=Mollisia scopiformis TaxID=149040 RepID=A0A194XSW5_MOLSC|nr:uncharacterized protein LY89DRAFT_763295 [Mollisia scopiformis]KUJ22822.1 hypothetical protein LY89DRAFT_763295 [Mollisia scopiformis]
MSFTCFPRLPAELRLKIWKHSLPGPRIITMYMELRAGHDLLKARAPEESELNALYYACKDSHNVLKAAFKRQFHGVFMQCPIWFNEEIDTILFASEKAMSHFFVESSQRRSTNRTGPYSVKYLILGYPLETLLLVRLGSADELAKEIMFLVFQAVTRFINLRQLTFVLGSAYEFDTQAVNMEFRSVNHMDKEAPMYLGAGYGENVLDDLKFELVRLTDVQESWSN